jgi:hypothetical protein
VRVVERARSLLTTSARCAARALNTSCGDRRRYFMTMKGPIVPLADVEDRHRSGLAGGRTAASRLNRLRRCRQATDRPAATPPAAEVVSVAQ